MRTTGTDPVARYNPWRLHALSPHRREVPITKAMVGTPVRRPASRTLLQLRPPPASLPSCRPLFGVGELLRLARQPIALQARATPTMAQSLGVPRRLAPPIRRLVAGGRPLAGHVAAGALLLAFGFARPSLAQVNVEPLRQQVARSGFGVRARASLASYAGNTQGVILGSSALVGVGRGRHHGYAVLSGDYTDLNSVVSVAKWFAHARYNYELYDWLWWEQYAQIESDRFRRVVLRELVGTGPRFGLFRSEQLELFYGASYMLEHIDLNSDDPSARGQGTFHRLSNYASITVRVHERILLSSVTYAQPRFDRPSDITVLSVNAAEFTVTRKLASRVDATMRYDSVVPSDVRPADLELKSSLELVF
jgi:hypothetical protein